MSSCTQHTRRGASSGTDGLYDNIRELEYLHGHDGKTKIVWLDEIEDSLDEKKLMKLCIRTLEEGKNEIYHFLKVRDWI